MWPHVATSPASRGTVGLRRAVPRIHPAAHGRAGLQSSELSVTVLPKTAVVLSPVLVVLPRIAVAWCRGVSVLSESAAVGSWGCELLVAIRAAAPICLAVDSETAAVTPKTPSAGPGTPVVVESGSDNSPTAADNWLVDTSNSTEAICNQAAGIDTPHRVALNGPGTATIECGTRDIALGTTGIPAGPAEKGKADLVRAGFNWVVGGE